MLLPQLKRIRWAVRAALILGVAASVAANVLHAQPNPISQTISAWPPLALLLTVELTSRIPMHKPLLAAVRVLATVAIAGIAAWVSYWHMQGVAVRYGETETSAYLLPISVDGLIVVASVSLVELAGRIRHPRGARLKAGRSRCARRAGRPGPVRRAGSPRPAAAPVFQQPAHGGHAVARGPVRLRPTPPATPTHDDDDADHSGHEASADDHSDAPVSPAVGSTLRAAEPVRSAEPSAPSARPPPSSPSVAAATRPAPPYVDPGRVTRAAVSAPARTVVTAAAESATPRQRRPVLETADLADAIEAMQPGISPAELAKELGISPTRLRAVRREARDPRFRAGGNGPGQSQPRTSATTRASVRTG